MIYIKILYAAILSGSYSVTIQYGTFRHMYINIPELSLIPEYLIINSIKESLVCVNINIQIKDTGFTCSILTEHSKCQGIRWDCKGVVVERFSTCRTCNSLFSIGKYCNPHSIIFSQDYCRECKTKIPEPPSPKYRLGCYD